MDSADDEGIQRKTPVRMNDLAHELNIKSRHVLEFLHERGIHGYTHSSWVNSSLAGELRAEFSDPPLKSGHEVWMKTGWRQLGRRRRSALGSDACRISGGAPENQEEKDCEFKAVLHVPQIRPEKGV